MIKKSIELTDKIVDEIIYNDIIAITIAEGGAMGEPNAFYAVSKNLQVYYTNMGLKNVDFKKLKDKFLILNSIECFAGQISFSEKGWESFYMGFGNYLIVRDNYYEKYKQYIKDNLTEDYESGELYKQWYDIFKKIK